MSNQMDVQYFFDEDTSTFTYVVTDKASHKCAIIDPVMDFDMYAGQTGTSAIDPVIRYIKDHNLTLEWILETHAHADHLTSACYIQDQLGGKKGIGKHILDVLELWVPKFNTSHDTPLDGSQFEYLFKDGDSFTIGDLKVNVMHTPGHTPACLSYVIEDCAFVGDTLFMPHLGTARADFPGGNAEMLYESIQKLLALPDDTKIYVCHDYPEDGEKPECVATVAAHKENNKMVHLGVSKDEYIQFREARDKTLGVPKLILPSLQVNLRAGDLGDPEDNGIHYIKLPLNQL